GRLPAAKRQRWLGHCIAAAKQSGLNWLPAILDGVPLGDFLTNVLTGPAGYVGVVGVVDGGSRPIREVLARAPAGREICLLIGPEGGLTRAELADIVEAGFTPVRLGRTTLRVETAAVALLAAAMAVYGEP
ncbi:MAG: RsmE family RNA methyltransferase, partial [Phycisphaerae bacterium]